MSNKRVVKNALRLARRVYATDGSVPYPKLTSRTIAENWTPPEDVDPRLGKFMAEYPAKMAESIAGIPQAIWDTVKYPGQLLYGEKQFDTDEAVKRAVDTTGAAMTGSFPFARAAAGDAVLGSGPIRKTATPMSPVSEMFDSPGMTQWREGSVIPAAKVEDRWFTGTSKDKDFPDFKVDRHGAWFTKDPAEASSYALANDSKGYKRDGWNIVSTNTADRVVPAYLRAENPYTGPKPENILHAENYKKAQSDWFDQLRAQGYDAWMPESTPGLAVILKEPSQIKSAISNTGDFGRKAKRTDQAKGGVVNNENNSNPVVDRALVLTSKKAASRRGRPE